MPLPWKKPNSLLPCPKRLAIEASLSFVAETLHLSALVDSGSEVVQQAGFPIEPLKNPLIVRALDGKFLTRITHQATPLHLFFFLAIIMN